MSNDKKPVTRVKLTKTASFKPDEFSWSNVGYWAEGPLISPPAIGERTGLSWIEKGSRLGDTHGENKYVHLTTVEKIVPHEGTSVLLHTRNSIWRLDYL